MRLFKGIFGKVDQLLTGRRPVDDDLYDELEELLIQADINIHTTTRVVDELRKETRKEWIKDSEDVKTKLKEMLSTILEEGGSEGLSRPQATPAVYLFVGVNGVGKTTSIAKLANLLKKEGKSVMLAAADTFRAAAIDQLEIWAQRAGVEIVKQEPGSDPSSVIFEACQKAVNENVDAVICDTAGRLHTRANLMSELGKIGRTVEKATGHPPLETVLVLDATTGQNAVIQAKEFSGAVEVSAICLTKIDGTAKGGIVITIKDELGIPIKLATTGEKLEDIEEFNAKDFVEALFD